MGMPKSAMTCERVSDFITILGREALSAVVLGLLYRKCSGVVMSLKYKAWGLIRQFYSCYLDFDLVLGKRWRLWGVGVVECTAIPNHFLLLPQDLTRN